MKDSKIGLNDKYVCIIISIMSIAYIIVVAYTMAFITFCRCCYELLLQKKNKNADCLMIFPV